MAKAPVPREQLVLFADCLEDRIPENHPVRLLAEILDGHDWSDWEAEYDGLNGQAAIHPGELLATIYHAFGIDPQTIVLNHLNQPRELVKAEALTSLFV